MNQEINTASKNSIGSNGLSITYDTDSISIVAKFSDEMSAYRGRKGWSEILSAHFLLEDDRDYNIKVMPSEGCNTEAFKLKCEFDSACGRYAFWRLINHQAPEAEEKLIQSGYPENLKKKKSSAIADFICSEEEGPWILSKSSSEGNFEEENIGKGLLSFILGLFNPKSRLL